MAEWIDDDSRFSEIVDDLVNLDRVAIDTEFHRERTYWPVCALVQIGWDNGRVLVDPLAVDMTKLAPVLAGPTIVMHAAGQDLEVFQHSVGAVPRELFDTQIAASFVGMASIGLAPLVKKELSVDLPKADRLTDWLVRPLPDSAKTYAESDVVHLFTLHDLLVERLTGHDRLDWVTDECASMVAKSQVRQPPETAWWKIKEGRRLTGRAAAVAQSVAAWREAHAAETDRPLRSVLPDLALASIAQRPPKTADDLSKIRGLRDRGIPRSIRADVIAAVEAGRALDLDAVVYRETTPVPADCRPAVPLLMSWVTQRARELSLDPAVLATRGDLELFLAGSDESRLASGWRRSALAAELESLLDGNASLTFKRGTGLVLRPIESI